MSDIFDLAARNLADTYLALGSQVLGARPLSGHRLQGITSAFSHVMGNFAIGVASDRTSAFEAWRLSGDNPVFHVYVPTRDDGGADAAYTLQGFQRVYRQAQMVFRGSVPTESPARLCVLPCDSRLDRETIADFVARQFFANASPVVRDEIGRVVARASNLQLYGAWPMLDRKTHRNLVGAYSLSVGDAVGIYNFCVESGLRGQGKGSEMLRMLIKAAPPGKPIVLQCDPSLVGWYERADFEVFGWLDVYARSRP